MASTTMTRSSSESTTIVARLTSLQHEKSPAYLQANRGEYSVVQTWMSPRAAHVLGRAARLFLRAPRGKGAHAGAGGMVGQAKAQARERARTHLRNDLNARRNWRWRWIQE